MSSSLRNKFTQGWLAGFKVACSMIMLTKTGSEDSHMNMSYTLFLAGCVLSNNPAFETKKYHGEALAAVLDHFQGQEYDHPAGFSEAEFELLLAEMDSLAEQMGDTPLRIRIEED